MAKLRRVARSTSSAKIASVPGSWARGKACPDLGDPRQVLTDGLFGHRVGTPRCYRHRHTQGHQQQGGGQEEELDGQTGSAPPRSGRTDHGLGVANYDGLDLVFAQFARYISI
jgi:hypothetical protein